MKLRYALPALACCLLLAGCGSRTEAEAREFTLAEQGAYMFSDGVSVDRWQLWHWGDDYYRLPDGTDLLLVREPMGPENVFNDHEGFQDLNEAAREAVLTYYVDRGLLYDVEEELERAYDLYLRCRETGEEYQNGIVEQAVLPAGSTSRIIHFQTTLTLPMEEPRVVSNTILNEIFDRETGEPMSVWELFAVSEEEARRQLLREMRPMDITDSPAARAAIAAALRPEYISIEPDCIQVWFPEGTLPEEEYDGWVLHYRDLPALLDILQPWAIPETGEEAE